MNQTTLLSVARGESTADLVLRGGMVANVFTGELEAVDLAIFGSLVAGLGAGYEGTREIDVSGKFILPGLIDAHVHIESSLSTPGQFARAVVPRGTTTVVCDPHEIANVHGLDGIRYMLDASEDVCLSVFVMASSCVPATAMETTGAALDAADLEVLRAHPRVLGLAEVMNFPGVIFEDPEVAAKIRAFEDSIIDGHAPGVRGKALNAYVAGGPQSDHECTTPDEATEKLRRGLWVFFREATNARNLGDLLPALTPENRRRVALCTDDRQPPDLLDHGGIDHMLRTVVQAGVPPLEALRLATLNPADYFGLRDRGALAPGRRADLLIVDDLHSFDPVHVYVGGKAAAERGTPLWQSSTSPSPPPPAMRVDWDRVDVSIPVEGERVRVIRAIPNQIVTESFATEPRIVDGRVSADVVRDILKIAVIERYSGSGRVGLGLVNGLGLRAGALAGTVAHDHHNIIVVGADDASMLTAAHAVAKKGGGLAAADGQEVVAFLGLPIGGLMSDEPIEKIRSGLDDLLAGASKLGCDLHDPFMALSFLGLEVIPSLKITDHGLIDVDAFSPIGLWV